MTAMLDRQCGSRGVDADGHCTRCGLVPEADTECPPGFLVAEPGFVISSASDAREALIRLLYEAFCADRKAAISKLPYEGFAFWMLEHKQRIDELCDVFAKASAREIVT